MKTYPCHQTITVLSILAAFSPAAANPVPESYDASSTDYLPYDDSLSLSGVNLDDSTAWNLDQSNPDDLFLPYDSTGTTDSLNMNPIDGSSIAWGSLLKGPYCGTTEQPVCCKDPVGFTDCKYCETRFLFSHFHPLLVNNASKHSHPSIDTLHD